MSHSPALYILGKGVEMKQLLLLFTLMMLMQSVVYADKIYLTNGKIIKGRITSENSESILIEYDDTWERIQKNDIEKVFKGDSLIAEPVKKEPINIKRIHRNNDTFTTHNENNDSLYEMEKEEMVDTRNEVPIGSDLRKSEGIIKFGYDMKGKQDASGSLYLTGYGNNNLSYAYDTIEGITIALEGVNYINNNVGLGCGFAYLNNRKYKDYTGDFNFMDLYALMKVASGPDVNGFYVYGVGHIGLSINYGDENYKGTGGKLENGTYSAIGVGVVFDNIVFEIVTTVNTAKHIASGYIYDYYYGYTRYVSVDETLKYSKYTFSVGYKF